MTSAPACAKSLTAAAPMPREPPVMSAALPASEIMIPPESFESKIFLAKNSNFQRDRAAGRGDEVTEQPLGKRIASHALRMPLNPEHPIRIAGPFDPFDDSIRRVRGDAQILSRLLNCLMMRTVDLRLPATSNTRQPAAGFERCAMNRVVFAFRHSVLLPVRSRRPQLTAQILDKCSAKIDVQELATITDGQYGLFLGQSVFQNRAAGLLAGRVSRLRFAAVYGAVFGGLNVGRASGKHEGIQPGKKELQTDRVLQ